LISALSYKITFNKELWTSIFPLYSTKPNLRNLFMKKLTRDRVDVFCAYEGCELVLEPRSALKPFVTADPFQASVAQRRFHILVVDRAYFQWRGISRRQRSRCV
jgi:hypothetical protein